MELSPKQVQFNLAMERYQTLRRYTAFGKAVSLTNVSLQIALLYRMLPVSIGIAGQAFAFTVAFLVTDLVNGIVHMFMDNNDSYDSIFGPFIANFHLHHKVMQYKKNNLLVVYFNESGSKVWLVPYLLAVYLLLGTSWMNPVTLYALVFVGILSSVAEVSHYLCHSSDASLSIFLGNARVLLPKRHHARHHLEDNRNYAFLNGFSDPLLNVIANTFYPGYKETTDTHYAHFVIDAESR